jgi:hypothetical protein
MPHQKPKSVATNTCKDMEQRRVTKDNRNGGERLAATHNERQKQNGIEE